MINIMRNGETEKKINEGMSLRLKIKRVKYRERLKKNGSKRRNVLGTQEKR